MSKLRRKLQQARHEYQHQRYPGDLANDLLGRGDVIAPLSPARKPTHWVRNLALAAALAVVATAGIVLLSKQSNQQNKEMAIVTTPTDNVLVDPTTSSTDGATTNPQSDPTQVKTDEEEAEERWSLVPSGIASSQETSFSLVPSLSYDETESETSENGIAQ